MRSLVFDTADRDNIQKSGTSQYTIYFNQVIECQKMTITNIIIPHSFYNVNYNNNKMTINGIVYYIPVGCYDAKDIINYLQTIFNKLLPVEYRLQIDNITFKYNPINLKTELRIVDEFFTPYNITFDTCYELFGFENNKEYTFEYTDNIGVIISENVCNINSIPAVYLRSNALHTRFVYNNSITSILFRIPVDKQFGEYLVFQDYSNSKYINVNNLTHLDIRLTDFRNKDIDLNGLDFKVEFTIE